MAKKTNPIEIQGEWIVVTYPSPLEKLPRLQRGTGGVYSFYIDIKTKTVMAIWRFGVPRSIRAGYQPRPYFD